MPPVKKSDSNQKSDSETRRRADVLTGDLRKTVFWLALPVLFEQFLSFCVGFYDTYLSGQISVEATSAIGLGAYVGWLATMLFGLVGTGTTALVARSCGAGEFAEANRIANRAIALALVMGAAVCCLIVVAAPGFAHLLDMHGETGEIVVRYLRYDALGHLFTGLSLAGAAALRGAGDMRSPMLILGWVSVFNVIASTALVYGWGPFPEMKIDGIVAGTVLARASGGLLMIFALTKGISGLKLTWNQITLRGDTVRRILRIGGPAALQGALEWGGQFAFLMIIANLATGTLKNSIFAAHIIGIRVEAITYLPAVAWGYAAATMIGQSIGAGDRKRAIQVGHEATLQCLFLGLLITVVFFTQASGIYTLMHDDQAVHTVGVPAFRMLAFFQMPLVVSIVYVFALRGAGDTRFPLFITGFGVFGVRVPLAYLCGIVLEGGLIGAWIGMCADMAVRALLVYLRYVRGRWVETRI